MEPCSLHEDIDSFDFCDLPTKIKHNLNEANKNDEKAKEFVDWFSTRKYTYVEPIKAPHGLRKQDGRKFSIDFEVNNNIRPTSKSF